MKPLRDVSDNVSLAIHRNNFKIMVYDSNRGEIAYDSSYNGTGNIDLTNVTAETVTAETVKVSKSLFLTSVIYTDARRFFAFFPTSCRDFFINNIPKMNNWGEFFQKVFFNFRFWTKKNV